LQQGLSLDSDEIIALASSSNGSNPGNSMPSPNRGAEDPTLLSQEQLSKVVLPPTTYPSMEQLTPHGMYLLDHSSALVLYIGPEVDEELIKDTFGSDSPPPTQLKPNIVLPKLKTEFSLRLWTIIASLRAKKPYHVPVIVVSPNDVDRRANTARYFSEDKFGSSPSYVDLLCEMHASIQKKLSFS
jgi:hypothetical protein